MRPTYSIVIPINDEQETLPHLHRELSALFERLDGTAEVILVDDGSRDASYQVMLEIHQLDPRFKLLRLSRNFGKEVAMTAGLDLARGDAVVLMDGDLQHPPETVLEMAALWRDGYEVVYGVMQQRTEGLFKRTTSRAFYRVLGRLSDIDVPPAVGDFRLVDRKALDAFKLMRERNRYVRGMFSWLGFRQIGISYQCPPRLAGRTKFSPGKLMKLALDGVIGFSSMPLEIVLRLGFVVSVVSFLFGASTFIVKVAGVYSFPGYATIVIAISFASGVQLMVLGVMGQYIARTYDEVRFRPLYLFSDVHGFDEEEVTAVERRGLAFR